MFKSPIVGSPLKPDSCNLFRACCTKTDACDSMLVFTLLSVLRFEQSVAQNTGCFICVHGIISEESCNGAESRSTVMVLEGIDSWLTAQEHGFESHRGERACRDSRMMPHGLCIIIRQGQNRVDMKDTNNQEVPP